MRKLFKKKPESIDCSLLFKTSTGEDISTEGLSNLCIHLRSESGRKETNVLDEASTSSMNRNYKIKEDPLNISDEILTRQKRNNNSEISDVSSVRSERKKLKLMEHNANETKVENSLIKIENDNKSTLINKQEEQRRYTNSVDTEINSRKFYLKKTHSYTDSNIKDNVGNNVYHAFYFKIYLQVTNFCI